MDEIDKVNRIEEIRSRVSDSPGIYFKRIPKKEWDWFRNYARDEWCDDYGLAFASILKGIIPPDVEIFSVLENHEERIKQLEAEIVLLKSGAKAEEKKEIKMGDGRTLLKR